MLARRFPALLPLYFRETREIARASTERAATRGIIPAISSNMHQRKEKIKRNIERVKKRKRRREGKKTARNHTSRAKVHLIRAR